MFADLARGPKYSAVQDVDVGIPFVLSYMNMRNFNKKFL